MFTQPPDSRVGGCSHTLSYLKSELVSYSEPCPFETVTKRRTPRKSSVARRDRRQEKLPGKQKSMYHDETHSPVLLADGTVFLLDAGFENQG